MILPLDAVEYVEADITAQPVGGGLDMNALVGAVRIAIRPVERYVQ